MVYIGGTYPSPILWRHGRYCNLLQRLMDATDPRPQFLQAPGLIRRTCQARGSRWSGRGGRRFSTRLKLGLQDSLEV